MPKIKITSGEISMDAEINQSPTARSIVESLPVEGSANIWGDEIYFEIPVAMEQESDAREVLEMGELGYWPVGRAFCIFFGPTPVSTDERPRAYSPVNILGRLLGDPLLFKSVKNGDRVRIELIDP
jgi:hypothetical protein